MKRLVCSLILLVAAFVGGRPADGATAYHPHWTRCVLHYGPQGGFQSKDCMHYSLLRHTHRPTGHTYRAYSPNAQTQVRVRYPTFYRAPVVPPSTGGYTVWEPVTGYSWGCGTPNGVTADGSVPIAGYTVASNDPALWHHYIYVPSLGFRGYVQDRGAPLDLFMSSCAATYSVTGYRAVIVY